METAGCQKWPPYNHTETTNYHIQIQHCFLLIGSLATDVRSLDPLFLHVTLLPQPLPLLSAHQFHQHHALNFTMAPDAPLSAVRRTLASLTIRATPLVRRLAFQAGETLQPTAR